jgi:uncharacterized protein (TIGR02118 family)
MAKMLIFLKRRPGLSRDEFAQWWLERHRPLAERLPGLNRHAFNLLPEGHPYDAVIEQWFESDETARSAYEGEPGQAVARDSLSHVSERLRVAVEAHEFEVATGP